MEFDLTRSRGILTKADKRYLLGEADLGSESAQANAASRVRTRLTDAILDFTLLTATLSADDIDQVFTQAATDEDILDGVSALLTLTYMGLDGSGVAFDHVLERAVRDAEHRLTADTVDSRLAVDVSVDVTTTVEQAHDDTLATIADGEPVTPHQVFAVLATGRSLPADVDIVHVDLSEHTGADRDAVVDRLARLLTADVDTASDDIVLFHRGDR